jgi:hypothetical protein
LAEVLWLHNDVGLSARAFGYGGEVMAPAAMRYIYSWGPRGNMPGAMSRKGQTCRIIAPPAGKKAAMNSALVEFDDGYQAVVSRNALRRERA